MPLYEYDCQRHGVFETLHSMHDAALPERCPSCGSEAPRVLSAPRLACVTPNERIARDRNEKSRHEPRVSKKASNGQSNAKGGKRDRPALRSSHGARPWAIGH
jgi:putative FmdB family regulatory protein